MTLPERERCDPLPEVLFRIRENAFKFDLTRYGGVSVLGICYGAQFLAYNPEVMWTANS